MTVRGARLAAGLLLASPAFAQGTQVESQIEAPGPQGPLVGSFVDAGAGTPVVVLIPGSGPTDRDGNNPLGVRGSSYKLLAQGLAAQGVSSVRVDKRGLFGSKAAVADPTDTNIAAYGTDAQSWIDTIRTRTGARCVWLAGHSEGGLVVLAAAQKAEHLCGLILIAAAGRPMGEVIREQLESNPANAPILPRALAALDSLEKGQTVDVAGLPPVLAQGLFNPKVQPYLIDMMSYRPAELAAAYKGPMMIVSGGRDLQVTAPDAQALAKAAPAAKRLAIPEMNHVLKRVESDDRAVNFATYGDASLPLMPGLAEGIANFVKAHS